MSKRRRKRKSRKTKTTRGFSASGRDQEGISKTTRDLTVPPDSPISGTEFACNRAYLIGIDGYSNGIPQLRTPANDAAELGRLLEGSHEYRVCLFPRDGSVTLGGLEQLINETIPREVGKDDRVVFYFAGHGTASDGDDGPEGFLVPEDARREDNSSFLPMRKLHDALVDLPCRHLLLILDCCFAGAFRWSSTRHLGEPPGVIHRERYERYVQDPAWQVISSAAYDQKALDFLSGRHEQGEHSPFAEALFRALEGEADVIPSGGDGVITASELYLYLRERVETATKKQTPGLWPLNKHDKGEYIFLTPGRELNLPNAPVLKEDNNPYRGLSSFEEENSKLFFGRKELTKSLHQRVRKRPLTVVLGASGTGKSSLVKAGLIKRLGTCKDRWTILEYTKLEGEEPKRVKYIRPGAAPLTSLAGVTNSGGAIISKSDLQKRTSEFRANSEGFSAFLQDRIKIDPSQKILLVVDQFEELITLCNDSNERSIFLEQLINGLRRFPKNFRLVITLRSDFEPQFAERGFEILKTVLDSDESLEQGDKLEDGSTSRVSDNSWNVARFLVPPMSQDELRDVIEKPAAARVIYFEDGLVDQLINEVVNMPGGLPLLSFALSELYFKHIERRSNDRCITTDDYDQIGGVVGSLRRRATEIYDELGREGESEKS